MCVGYYRSQTDNLAVHIRSSTSNLVSQLGLMLEILSCVLVTMIGHMKYLDTIYSQLGIDTQASCHNEYQWNKRIKGSDFILF